MSLLFSYCFLSSKVHKRRFSKFSCLGFSTTKKKTRENCENSSLLRFPKKLSCKNYLCSTPIPPNHRLSKHRRFSFLENVNLIQTSNHGHKRTRNVAKNLNLAFPLDSSSSWLTTDWLSSHTTRSKSLRRGLVFFPPLLCKMSGEFNELLLHS